MHVLALFATFLAASGASAARVRATSTSATTTTCAKETVAYETFIGQDKNVKVQYSHCDGLPHVAANGEIVALDKRQSTNSTNVCGAPCQTNCFTPSGGGPNEADCTVIADALLFDSQNVGALFNITATGTATDKITMQYKSCLTFFLNQDFNTLVYCRTEWSALVNFLASDCNAANNAHGGLCVANDQRWFVQVQNTAG
ncbi:hypothetical protein C8Q74DRAFT_142405 [Fomes fomentarius]|nr:hypothetical protein C8Q74DRAFT_142405 [Fomes fomentarius]